jgi:cell division protein FtsB
MQNGNYTSWKKILSSPIAFFLVLVVFVVLARSAWNMYKSAEVSSTKLAHSEAELSRLQSDQEALVAKVAVLSTPAGVENELRSKYRAVKEGESVAVIVKDDKPVAPQATSTSKVSWWRSVVGFFGF